MNSFRNPTPADQFEYLLQLYFGSDPDRLSSCVARAYRDFNRTLRGLVELPEHDVLRDKASRMVRRFVAGLANRRVDQSQFDQLHMVACVDLCLTYSAGGFDKFCVGQAQKWLNMAVKYVFVFGEDRLPGYAGVFEMAHVPIDNIILDKLCANGLRRPATPWSKMADYAEYMHIQHSVRSAFPGMAPLAVEFALWQSGSAKHSAKAGAKENSDRESG